MSSKLTPWILLAALLIDVPFARAEAVGDGDFEICKALYAASADASVQAAGEFLANARDDYDYPSIDEMAAWIRKERGLPQWSNPQFLDPINYNVAVASVDAMSEFCAGEPRSLQQIRVYLLAHVASD